ncbi:MAG: hypothetical protein IIU44_02515 [Spirochaetales bacterium]|nr:hypothetical protein [Spirochaetales bacterium]
MDDKTKTLVNQCIRSIDDIKRQEDELKAKRIKAETWLMETLKVNPADKKTESFENETFKVSFKKNVDTKVDYDKLIQIKAEHKDIDLSTLFRFKAEVAAKGYNAATDEVKALLAPALTTKANKPQIEIIYKEG